VLRSDENWLDVLIIAGGEAVHRAAAEARARAAEQHCSALERQAMLGRYMLEMRHGLNNALTSLAGKFGSAVARAGQSFGSVTGPD